MCMVKIMLRVIFQIGAVCKRGISIFIYKLGYWMGALFEASFMNIDWDSTVSGYKSVRGSL